MAKYRHSAIKTTSFHRKYEHIRQMGMPVPTGVGDQTELLKGDALDNYLDEAIWRAAHPGQEPIREWDDAVSAK